MSMRGKQRRQIVYIDDEAFLFRGIVQLNTLKIEGASAALAHDPSIASIYNVSRVSVRRSEEVCSSNNEIPETGTYSNKNRETIAEKRPITMRD
jgi:hypothetical protein